MSCTRSVYSWDIIVQRVGSKLFFDKRDNSDFGEEKSWKKSVIVVSLSFLYAFVCFLFFLIYVSVPRLRHLEQTGCFNMLLTVRVLPILICFSMGGRDSLKQIQILPMYNSLWLVLFSDLLTVSETANEPPQEEGNSFNSPRNLAMEATYINHNFSQQCLRMVRLSSPGQ